MKNFSLAIVILAQLASALVVTGATAPTSQDFTMTSEMEAVFAPPASSRANMSIRRNRDGRVITGQGTAYPNDRVARGEGYTLEIAYSSDSMVSGSPGPNNHAVKVVMKIGGRAVETRYFNNSRSSVTFKWGGSASTNVNDDNITFEAYNNQGGRLDSVRLPIGRYFD